MISLIPQALYPVLPWAWVALGAAIGGLWLLRLFTLGAVLSKRRFLGSQDSQVEANVNRASVTPKVSVLIAAKDEEGNVGACVESLLVQDYPDFELIVINDRSRDRTAEILANLRRRDEDRLRVLTVTSLRDGYVGKTNAMREGMTVATGDWLLFTDADCLFTSPRAISVAVNEAIENEADFLSVIPELEVRAAWERIIQPVCALVLMMWFRPDRVNDPRLPTAYANGAFMLMRRSCYDAIGGHENARGELNEDIQMARIAKGRGFRLLVAESDGLFRTRMYDSLSEGLRGWSRIFAGALRSPGRVAMAALVVVAMSITPGVSLLISVIGAALTPGGVDGTPFWTTAILVWMATTLMVQTVTWRMYSAIGFGRAWSLTYILGAAVTVGVLLNSLLKASGVGTVTWRGTTYRGGRVVSDAAGPTAESGSGRDT